MGSDSLLGRCYWFCWFRFSHKSLWNSAQTFQPFFPQTFLTIILKCCGLLFSQRCFSGTFEGRHPPHFKGSIRCDGSTIQLRDIFAVLNEGMKRLQCFPRHHQGPSLPPDRSNWNGTLQNPKPSQREKKKQGSKPER